MFNRFGLHYNLAFAPRFGRPQAFDHTVATLDRVRQGPLRRHRQQNPVFWLEHLERSDTQLPPAPQRPRGDVLSFVPSSTDASEVKRRSPHSPFDHQLTGAPGAASGTHLQATGQSDLCRAFDKQDTFYNEKPSCSQLSTSQASRTPPTRSILGCREDAAVFTYLRCYTLSISSSELLARWVSAARIQRLRRWHAYPCCCPTRSPRGNPSNSSSV